MLKHVVLLLALLQMPVVFADETSQEKSKSPDEMAKLIDRIDQLEKRIKELERQVSRPQTVTVVPQYQPYNAPPNQPYIPNANLPPTYYQPVPGYEPVPGTPSPYVPQTPPAVPYPPQYQPNKTVPDSWKPFNFNGMQYYIIPVDEAVRMSHPQTNDRTNR